jgi:hypothetical protein
MKKTARRRPPLRFEDDLRTEYDFDYSKSRPNRFAAKVGRDCIAVILDPDVASVFRHSGAINNLLRSVIAALPSRDRSSSRPRQRA